MLQLAESYRSEGDCEQAIAIIRSGLAKMPEPLAARLLLGRCYLEKDLIPEAKEELERVVKGIEECLPVYKLLSQVYLREKNVDKALEALRKALFFSSAEEAPSKKVTPLEMGLLRGGSRPPFVTPPIQSQEAIPAEASLEPPVQEKAEASRKAPIQTDTLAEIFIKQGHLGKALATYQEILTREPENPVIREKVKALQKKLAEEGKEKKGERALGRMQQWLEVVAKKVESLSP
ncbi:MAG: tetratricopeptide repeat protein [Deltaproteobacteria bacterium]|nr:tetratricopeptide repeat protein [Deltaproteobacteria bacterium]